MNSNEIIERVTAALLGQAIASEEAMWEAIAVAFETVTGRPMDRLGPYDLMLAYAVTTKLAATDGGRCFWEEGHPGRS